MSGREDVAAAYLRSCQAELDALKPGNVHVHAAGHGMTVADFAASARASAPVMGDPDLSVGQRILEAVRRSRAAVDCNTNLGIVLLCAPLAQAAMAGGGDFRSRLGLVLDGLTIADAEQAFAAIRLAQPGGLGSSESHDVNLPATVTLRAAMAASADRDRIAAQFVSNFADLFGVGLPALAEGLDRWADRTWATMEVHMAFMARFPDSHIARKCGDDRAEHVRAAAQRTLARLREATDRDAAQRLLLDLDSRLKSDGLNPGTSADLTVATCFLDQILAGGS
jgi:triphosphoribosyl-dephospho-CoA synthase